MTIRPSSGFLAIALAACLLVGNQGWLGGGAQSSVLRNCVVISNHYLGTFSCRNTNSIILGNFSRDKTSEENYSEYCSNSFSCTLPLAPGVGNITNDPQLTPSYRLKSTSPCIDAGSASNAPASRQRPVSGPPSSPSRRRRR